MVFSVFLHCPEASNIGKIKVYLMFVEDLKADL